MSLHANAVWLYISQWISITMMTKLIALDGSAGDLFGSSVSLSGDYALIGANGDVAYLGSAYILIRSGSVWNEQAKLTASDGVMGDYFGCSVSLSGDYALMGAYLDDSPNESQGSAYIFLRSGTIWSQQAKLVASDGAANDYFGIAVSLSGDYAIIGATHDDSPFTNQGSIYVFLRVGSLWNQQANMRADIGQTEARFGSSVSASGDYALVGAYGDDIGVNADQGSACVFIRSNTLWTQQAQLVASDGGAGDFFGVSVCLYADYALVGAYNADVGDNAGQGAAYIFLRSGSLWNQQAKLTASDGAAYDKFSSAVSLSGDYALVGASGDDSPSSFQGSAYVFLRSGTSWSQQAQLIAPDGAMDDRFGVSVSLSGDYALIGSYLDDSPNTDQGSSYLYYRTEASWTFACPTGTSINGAACDVCAMGKYNDMIGQSTCTNCGTGKFNDQTGSISSSSCMDCGTGKYNDQIGSTSSGACMNCATGKYNDMSAQAICMDCVIGTYNDQTGSISSVACIGCATGMYNSMVGQASCSDCATGKYQDQTGQSNCIDCSAGSYNSNAGQTSCVGCAVGKVNPNTGSTTSTACVDCSAGKYSNAVGMAACNDCEVGKYNSMTGQTSCTNCLAGTFNEMTAQSSCTSCGTGKYNSNTGSTSSVDCIYCGTGKANPNIGSSIETDCIDCATGTYNDQTGQGSCTDCVIGTYNDNVGSAFSTDCAACGEGKYNEQTGSTSIAACMDCVMGMYNDMTGQASCMDCGEDTYADMTGMTTCTACADGTCTDGATGSVDTLACVSCDDDGTVDDNVNDDGSGLLERATIIGLSLMTLIMIWA